MIGGDCSELNFASVAGFYAQLNAVLAGFAFAAIITLVTFRRTKTADQVDENIALAFVAAFLALVFGSVGYSILAGEPVPQARGRAATEELLLVAPFALSFMMLMYGLALAMTRGATGKAIVAVMSTLTVVVVPSATLPIAMNSLAYSMKAREIMADPAALCASSTQMPWPEEVLTILIVPITLASLLLAVALPSWRRWLRRARWLPAVVVMVISVLVTAMLGYVGDEKATFLFDDNVVHMMAIVFFACVCLCSVTMAADVTTRDDDAGASVNAT